MVLRYCGEYMLLIVTAGEAAYAAEISRRRQILFSCLIDYPQLSERGQRDPASFDTAAMFAMSAFETGSDAFELEAAAVSPDEMWDIRRRKRLRGS